MKNMTIRDDFNKLLKECRKKDQSQKTFLDCIEKGISKWTTIKDEKDDPLIVFHGTTFSFTDFEKELAKVNSDFGAGFYFTNQIEDAETYAGLDTINPDVIGRINIYLESNYRKHHDELSEELEQKGFTDEQILDYFNEIIPIPDDLKDYYKKYGEIMFGKKFKKEETRRNFLLEIKTFKEAYEKYVGKINKIIPAYLIAKRPAIVDTKEVKKEGEIFPETIYKGTYISPEELHKVVKTLSSKYMIKYDYDSVYRGYSKYYKVDPSYYSKEKIQNRFIRTIKDSLSSNNQFYQNNIWTTGGTVSEIQYALEHDMTNNIVKIGREYKQAKGEFMRELLETLGYDAIIINDVNNRYDIEEPQNIIHFEVFRPEQIIPLPIIDNSQKKNNFSKNFSKLN